MSQREILSTGERNGGLKKTANSVIQNIRFCNLTGIKKVLPPSNVVEEGSVAGVASSGPRAIKKHWSSVRVPTFRQSPVPALTEVKKFRPPSSVVEEGSVAGVAASGEWKI